MALLELRTGAQLNADSGALVAARGERTGGLVTQDAHGRWREAVSRGNVYTAYSLDTGVTIASLTLTTTSPFVLYNPKGSGVNLSVLHGAMNYVSGTFGGGFLAWSVVNNPNAVAPTGTLCGSAATSTYYNNLIGNQAVGKALPYYTVSVWPVANQIRPFVNIHASLATTVVAPFMLVDQIDGLIELAPGTMLGLQGVTAAGSSPLANFSITWEEVPIISAGS